MKRSRLITLAKRSCPVFALVLCCVLVLAAGGCGGGEEGATTTTSGSTTTVGAPAQTTTSTASASQSQERRAAVISEVKLDGMTISAVVTFEDGTTAPATFDMDEITQQGTVSGTNLAAGMECVVVSRDGAWVVVEVK